MHNHRLLQQKFFIRANKVEVKKSKSDEQTTASSSKESEPSSSSLRKRGDKATDSPRAKKVTKSLHIHNFTIVHCILVYSKNSALLIFWHSFATFQQGLSDLYTINGVGNVPVARC